MNKEREIRELVLARLDTFPPNRKISMGNLGEMSKEELREHIEKGDEIGKKFVQIQLEYLKTLAKGITI